MGSPLPDDPLAFRSGRATLRGRGSEVKSAQREWLQLKFKGTFHEKRGAAFQDWFADLMSARHPGDFQRIRAYGSLGDRKCDGFLRTTGTVFQCYAPREMKLEVLLPKLQADFDGAREQWPEELKGWTFVHNDLEGLPADAVQRIETFRRAHPELDICELTYEGLEVLALELPEHASVRLFGRPPTAKDFETIGFEQLAAVLAHIRAASGPPADVVIEPVSPTKLEANSLSAAVAHYLRLGRLQEPLVAEYFDKHPDPSFGETVADAFRREYQRLRALRYPSDDVFTALQAFASGSSRGNASHEAAVLAVLSYLFERCDIFEPAPEAEDESPAEIGSEAT